MILWKIGRSRQDWELDQIFEGFFARFRNCLNFIVPILFIRNHLIRRTVPQAHYVVERDFTTEYPVINRRSH